MVGSVLTIAVTRREGRWCPLTPRHASQDSCCRSNFGQVDGSFFFFVRRKRAIVRVNESCGGDVSRSSRNWGEAEG